MAGECGEAVEHAEPLTARASVADSTHRGSRKHAINANKLNHVLIAPTIPSTISRQPNLNFVEQSDKTELFFLNSYITFLSSLQLFLHLYCYFCKWESLNLDKKSQ